MDTIIAQFETDPRAPAMALRDRAKVLLRGCGLLRRAVLNARSIGIHPRNRYGDGIIPTHVADLISKFCSNGWSGEEAGIPLCVDMPPVTDPKHQERLAWNAAISNDVALLPPYKPGEMRHLSAEKTHSTQAMRCILEGSAHWEERICTDGKLDLHKVRQIAPELAAACEEGMSWDVLDYVAEERWPCLVDLLQEAGNLGQAVAKAETRLEVCLKMHETARKKVLQLQQSTTAQLTATEQKQVVWDHVLIVAARSSPGFADELPDLVKYVQNLSGGTTHASLLHELVAFSKRCSNPATIPAPVMAAVANAALGEDGMGCVQFRQDMLRACIASSETFCERGTSTLLGPDIQKKLEGKLLKMVQLADAMKVAAMEMVAEAATEETKVAAHLALDLFGIRMVHHVVQKPCKSRGIFKSLHDIGAAFVQQLADVTGQPLVSPWTTQEPAAPAPASASASSSSQAQTPRAMAGVVEHNLADAARRVVQLQNAGVEPGVFVQHTATDKKKSKWRVDGVSEDEVTLCEVKESKGAPTAFGLVARVNTPSFMKLLKTGAYTPCSFKPVIQDWITPQPCTWSETWKKTVIDAIVTVELNTIGAASEAEVAASTRICTAPADLKGVYTTGPLKAGVAIFPLTPMTKWIASSDIHAHSSNSVVKTGATVGDSIQLLQASVTYQKAAVQEDERRGSHEKRGADEFIPRFWLCSGSSTTTARDANMEWASHTFDRMIMGTTHTFKIAYLKTTKDVPAGKKLAWFDSTAVKDAKKRKVR